MKHKVLLFSLIIFNFCILTVIYFLMQKTGGKYIYPLDDTYIHMSISKTLAQSGTWGINKDVFASASSSPLFTVMLASLFLLFGINDNIPLVLNIVLINVFFVASFYFFKKVSKIYNISYILFFCFTNIFALLYVQVLSGMEHVLHILISFFAFALFYLILSNSQTPKRLILPFLLAVFCSVLIRFESLFFILPMSFVLLFFRRWQLSIYLLISAVLPILLFGIYSISHGGYFIPNSLIVKSGAQVSMDLTEKLNLYFDKLVALVKYREFSFIILATLVVFTVRMLKYGKTVELRKIPLIFVSISAIILHVLFANFGWFFRYEAYLFVLLLFSVILYLLQIPSRKVLLGYTLISLYLFHFTYGNRIIYSIEYIRWAGKNVYEQQYLNAQILRKFFNDKKVILGDLGAISYFTDCKVLDLVGLGTNEVAMQRFTNKYNALQLIKENSNEYDFLIMPYGWFSRVDYKRETTWIKVADFEISNNVYCYSNKIEIYANNILMAKKLRSSIIQLRLSIPSDVRYTIY